MRILFWALMAATTVMVVPGLALSLASPLAGWEVRGEQVSSPLPVPNVALVVARPRPTTELGPGAEILAPGGLYRVLALQRAGEGTVVLAQREADGAALSLVPHGEVLAAEAVVPYMGYGLARHWWGRALLAAPLALVAVAVIGARRRRTAAAEEAPQAEAVLSALGEGEVAAHPQALSEGQEVAASSPWAQGEPPPPEGEGSRSEEVSVAGTPAGPQEGELLDIFRRVTQEVRERTLAAEVEEVDMGSLLAELRELRRALGRDRGP